MIRVRHGLMIIGQEGTGKTSVYRVLQKAMNLMHREACLNICKVHNESIDERL